MEFKDSTSIYKILGWSLLVCIALLIIDELNLLSQFIVLPEWILEISVIVFICIILFLLDKGVYNLFRIKSINILDHILLVTTISSTMCFIYLCFRTYDANVKLYIYLSVFVISLILLAIRGLIVSIRVDRKDKTNIIDLQELYNNDIAEISPGIPVLIEDNDKVDYDLLNHNYIVQGLYQAIIHCYTDESFAFGLEGPWGSGKTTIINKVKKHLRNNIENKIIVIDDFDPWLFGNQESLLLSLYDIILSKMNIKVGRYKSQKYIRNLTSTIASTNDAGKIISSVLFNNKSDDINIVDIRNNLIRTLKASEYRYVIFIDNLDRADPDNVLFILKLIATYFDLPNIIYVLSYDKDRVCSILEGHKIDSNYLDKIIQTVYSVPMFIQSQRERIVGSCVKNLLLRKGVYEQEVSEYDAIIKYIIKKVDSIRSFKRYINSVYNIVFANDIFLSKRDLLAIETINYFDNELYNYIYFHREFFISLDRMIDSELWITDISSEESNKKAKEELDRLFERHPGSLDLLANMFPNIRRYKSKMDIFSKYNQYSEEEYNRARREMAICNARYFDLYYHNRMNHYAISEIDVRATIEQINIVGNDKIDIIISKKIEDIPEIYQKDWFEQFQLEYESISLDKQKIVILSLIQNWNRLDDTTYFMTLNARDRVAVIIQNAIVKYNSEELTEIIDMLEKHYDRFILINYLISLYRDENNKEDVKQQKQLLEECAARMCNNVIKCKINLLSDEYYLHGNTLAFVLRYKEINSELDNLANYITSIVTPQTIYRFLLEMISIGIRSSSQHKESVYVYYIKAEAEKRFSVDTKLINYCLEQNLPDNRSKEILADIYNKYLNSPSTTEDPEENGFTTIEEISFDDI